MDSYVIPTSNLAGLTTSRGEDCRRLPLSERALCSEAGVELAIRWTYGPAQTRHTGVKD